MDICISVMLADDRNSDNDPTDYSRGDVVSLCESDAHQVANPVCATPNLFMLIVQNVPTSSYRRLESKLIEQEEVDRNITLRRKWRIRLPQIPAPIRSKLVNPPHCAVVGWVPFKTWTQRKDDDSTIEDSDL